MMLRGVLFLLCAYVALVVGRDSPHAQSINNLLRDNNSYSNDINEDARLDVPQLIRKYGYPVEVHTVTTSDGYILEMHRIPHGRDANNKPHGNKSVVFVMHGLLGSSADWILMGPGFGLGYILADEGFDVWMGNARGNYYSRKHVRLNPDSILGKSFWNFSWDEIGNIDLPTMIDHVLASTQRQRIHYVGHSQGTTAFFVLTSLCPKYNQNIKSMHALAPVAFMAHNRNPFFQLLSPFSNQIEQVASLIGIGEFLPGNYIIRVAGQSLCKDEVVFQPIICSNILFLIGGRNENQLNKTMTPVIFGHIPAGASVRQFVHYGQGIAGKGFRRYDHGNMLANLRKYGSVSPPDYKLRNVRTQVFLYFSDSDPLVHVNDVDRLQRELRGPVYKTLIPKFSHFDFIWGIDAYNKIYKRVINIMKVMDVNGSLSTMEGFSDKV